MTGFGRGTARAGATEATVEVRSVNGRFAEVSVRTPRVLADRDTAVQARVREAVERGNVTVNVTLLRGGADHAQRVNAPAARAYADLLRTLREAAGLDAAEAPITLDLLLRQSDVFTTEADPAEAGEAWAAAEAALADALDALDAMRIQEGARLADELALRLRLLAEHLAAVEARAPARAAEAQARLRERLAELLGADAEAQGRLSADRLEQEVALLADRLDVTEETVRLRSHLEQFHDALTAREAVGRRLNFLAQELNREVNTIASKANDPAIAHHAVAMKEEVEKIREQVQNVV